MAAILASCSDVILTHDVANASSTSIIRPHAGRINAVRWNHNNQVLASAADDGRIVLSHHSSGAVLGTLPADATDSRSAVSTLCFSMGSRYLVSGGADRMVRVWDLKKKDVASTFKSHTEAVSVVTFNPADTHIASADAGGEILLHSLVSNQAVAAFKTSEATSGHRGIQALQFSPFRKSLLASGSDNGSVVIWDINSRAQYAHFQRHHEAPVTAVAFSPVNNLLLCSAALDQRIFFFDTQEKKLVKSIEAEHPLTSLAFHGDGHTVAAGTQNGSILIFDLRLSSTPKNILSGHSQSVNYMEFQHVRKDKEKDAKASAKPTGSTTAATTTASSSSRLNSATLGSTPTSLLTQRGGSSTRSSASDLLAVDSPVKSKAVSDILNPSDVFSPVQDVKPVATDSPILSSVRDRYKSLEEIKGEAAKTLKERMSNRFMSSSLSARELHRTAHFGTTEGSSTPTPTNITAPNGSQSPALSVTSVDASGVFSPVANGVFSPPPPSTSTSTSTSTSVSASSSSVPRSLAASRSLSLSTLPLPTATAVTTSTVSPTSTVHSAPVTKSAWEPTEAPSAAKSLAFSSPPAPTSPASSPSASPIRKANFLPLSQSNSEPIVESTTAQSTLASADIRLPLAVESQIDSVRSAVESHAIQSLKSVQNEASGPVAVQAPLSELQADLIRNIVEESLYSFKVSIHQDIQNLHLELLKQFHIQQSELSSLVSSYAERNVSLLDEIERLKTENRRLQGIFD